MKSLDLHPAMSALLRHYAQTGEIPSRTGLARLWGYQSRGWADKVATRLVASGFLIKRENGRLTPGPRFDIVQHEGVETVPPAGLEASGAVAAVATTLLIVATAASLTRNGDVPDAAPEVELTDLLLDAILTANGNGDAVTAEQLRGFPREIERRLLRRLEVMVANGSAERALPDHPARFRLTDQRWRQELTPERHARAVEAVERLGAHDRGMLERVLGFITREVAVPGT